MPSASRPGCSHCCVAWPTAASTPSRWTGTRARTTPSCCSPGARPASTRRATARCGRRSRTPCCRWHAPSRSPSSRTARVRRSSSRFTSWGGGSEAAARDVGRAIARSALVKTAIYGADPNWGRILAAAGAAGVPLAVDRLSLQVAADGEWLTLATGGATAHADPRAARAIFQQKTIRLRVDLGLGRAEAVVWTCDLTPDYVRINADYTS